MTSLSTSRRGFLKAAGLAAASGLHLPALAGTTPSMPELPSAAKPQGTWADVFAAAASPFFGVKIQQREEPFGNGRTGTRRKRVARDPATYYQPGGISGEEEPHSFGLSFEITNNNILCSATAEGMLRNPLIFSRMVETFRRGQSFRAAELLGGSPWSFAILREGDAARRLPMTAYSTVELLDALYPRFRFETAGLVVHQLAFAPDLGGNPTDNPRALIVVLYLVNPADQPWRGALLAPNLCDADEPPCPAWLASPAESPHPRFTEHPVPVGAGYEAILNLNAEAWWPRCPQLPVSLAPHESRPFCFGLLLDSSVDRVRASAHKLRQRSALEWFEPTRQTNRRRYGALSIPCGQYYAALLPRMIETDRSAILFSDSGECFNGGPSGATFILSAFEPAAPARDLDAVRDFKPRAAGTTVPASVSWSLVNTVGALAFTALYYRITGDAESLRANPGILPYAQETLTDVLATRDGELYLFPSKMLWDGPSPGDYNTGANIMAWLAFNGMASIAADVYGRNDLADRWRDVAARIRRDIYRVCIGPGPLGPRFYEGANKDGSFAPGHNGEEAFTTMAPFFGFCDADEPALIRHARLAFTKANPLYAPAVNGIWWNSNSFGNGTTMPGQIALLAAIENEQELLAGLEQLRKLVDLDGALWWWPYRYPCTDSRMVERRGQPADVSKCGYAASVFAAVFLTNVLGVYTDVPARQVRFRPLVPWPSFEWAEMRLGPAAFSIRYERKKSSITAHLVNLNAIEYDAALELTAPAGKMVAGSQTAGIHGPAIESRTRFGRASVLVHGKVASGARAELRVDLHES